MITLLHKYGKTIAIVATQSLNDALWGLIGDFALRLFHVAILLSLWRTVMAGQGVVAGMSLEAVPSGEPDNAADGRRGPPLRGRRFRAVDGVWRLDRSPRYALRRPPGHGPKTLCQNESI